MDLDNSQDDMMMDTEENYVDDGNEEFELGLPNFPPVRITQVVDDDDILRVTVPRHRLNPLKNAWMDIYQPIVDHMKLQIRFNTATTSVELKTSQYTEDYGALQKSADFVRAFILGFEVQDAIAMLRVEDLFIDSFEIGDVKQTLHGDHMSRAIGRLAGKDGKTKYAIENATRTRIVLADKHVHILGSYNNIKVAKDAIVALILGSPPNKVYAKLRTISSRLKQRF
eukprot:TRINITY_DN322_c0_g1_i1.p1 TRINITY_DN322_c0_g1~~TRINITY_DN322_c0_g1_i1.p1  ORF type:complete len:226 (+),score=64.81 TRINITY_DN322_c0_g1_i1:46-723(+)